MCLYEHFVLPYGASRPPEDGSQLHCAAAAVAAAAVADAIVGGAVAGGEDACEGADAQTACFNRAKSVRFCEKCDLKKIESECHYFFSILTCAFPPACERSSSGEPGAS